MNKYFIIFAIIVICTPSSWADSEPCTFTDQDGNFYDFSLLSTVTKSASIMAGTYTFYVTPCATTPQNTQVSKPCKKVNSPAIQVDQDNNCVYLADLNTQTFSKTPDGLIVIDYENGEPCGDVSRTTKISFMCDTTTESNLYQAQTDHPDICQYEFDWKTKYACKGMAPGSNPSGGLTGGAWFLIILFAIALPVYLIGGIIYNMKVKNATGVEVIPNIAFWRDFPSLIKEGCTFTFGKMCGRGGYQKV